MDTQQKVQASLDLLRRQDPNLIEQTLTGIIELAPDITTDLLTTVDQPLQTRVDPTQNREFLIADFNRDGDSYRSPWSNKYFDPMEGGAFPSPALREFEIEANAAFETYRELYFESGIQSTYVWDTEAPGFAACCLIKKDCENSGKSLQKGAWDSIHVFEVKPSSAPLPPGAQGTMFSYKLTTTIMLYLSTGPLKLSGSLSRQAVKEDSVYTQPGPHQRADHIKNMGTLLEDSENKMRTAVETLYFGKMKDIVGSVRSMEGVADAEKRRQLQGRMVFDLKK